MNIVPETSLDNEPILGTDNTEETKEFFSAFYGDCPGFLTIWDKQSKQTRYYSTTQFTEAAEACHKLAGRGLDVYFGVGLQEKALSPSTRGSAGTVSGIPGLWVDIDIAGPGHSSSDLPTTVADALKIIESLPFEPTVVVHSGGGLHVYWLFPKPWVLASEKERADAELLSKNFQQALRLEAKGHGWSLDNTADLARVLRVPCTKNFKDPKQPRDVTIRKADYTRRYEPQQFLEYLKSKAQGNGSTRNHVVENEPGDIEDIVNNCPFIQHCQDDYKSLSEPDWHAMITILHKVPGGNELIHKFSDNYPGGSWAETEQKIAEVQRTGLPCSCSHIQNQLGFSCPEGGCKVASPISFATNATVVARLRIRQLLPDMLDDATVCFEPNTLRWLAVLHRNDPMEFGRFKHCIKGKVHLNDLMRAIKQHSQEETKANPVAENEFFSSLSDNGNAERFVALFGDQIRYCNQTRKWYLWNGKRWIEDSRQQVKVLATQSLNQVCERARNELSGNELNDVLKWVERSRSNSGIKAMVEMAQYGEGIPVTLEDFDNDPYLLNCQNGTLNLKTGILQPHEQSDLISKIIPTDFDPAAECPVWNKFIATALYNDQSVIDYLATVVGITFSGVLLKKFFFVYGPSNTGKSMFSELIHFLLGDYGKGISMDILMTQKHKNAGGANPELFRLQGARGVFASETTDGRRLDEAFVKRTTGGDVIPVRDLYSSPVEFIPCYKLWLHGNHKPDIQGDDTGIWNRLVFVPFTNVIPPEEQDLDLLNKFKAELPGILAWAMRGCRKWIEAGEKNLEVPERFKLEGQAYQASMDTLGLFIEERCLLGSDKKVSLSALYSTYKTWCEENGSAALKSPKFANRMQERGYEQKRTKKERFWDGITINFMPDIADCINESNQIAVSQGMGDKTRNCP
jgi:P4 family phage/plasmid primase-like protien